MSGPHAYIALQAFAQDDPRPLQVLEQAGFAIRRNTLGRRLRREELAEQLREAVIVLAGLEPYDASVFEAAPALRCISRCGVGTDAIDLEAARRRGVTVLTTPDEVTAPVAQLTVAMILALARRLPTHLDAMRRGVWVRQLGALASEWTVGLVGFGRIGQAVARYLRPFGFRLAAHDPAYGPGDLPADVPWQPLPALLAGADVVSLHAGGRPGAVPLVGARELALMKRGSFLVNTARGFLVDETALAGALASGHLAGAALDVYAEEPYRGPLSRMPQVLCTPHIGSLTRASRAAMELRCAQQAVEWWRAAAAGEPVAHTQEVG
jgi:D-3-phosphoglycerate dehydrogenase